MPAIDADMAQMFGMVSVLEGGKLFCGVTEEQFAINGVTYQWPRGSKILWSLNFPKLGTLSDMDLKDAISHALLEISGCCDFSHAYTADFDKANLQITKRNLDGAMGVLADCQIPVGNVGPGTQLLMRLDDSEGWVISETPGQAEIDFYRVFLHEAEHGHGLGHKPSNVVEPALIAPIYSRTIRSLQQADKAELVRRYGVSAVVPPPLPPPAAKPVQVSVSQDGKVWSGQLNRTT